MHLKGGLILAGLVVISLLILSASNKWPPGHTSKPENQKVKSQAQAQTHTQEAFTSASTLFATSNLPRTPDNQDSLKLNKFPQTGLPVLMYHSISTIPGNSLGVPVQQFTEEMEWLQRQKYHALSLEDFYQALADKTTVPDKPILLTFDDGYLDNYSEAWPILRQNGFRATFFIITNSVGPGMMNWDQLSNLVREGNSIGSHTVHHLDLSTLSVQQQEKELERSKQELEQHLGINVQALCFPSGRYNDTTLKLMAELGYKLGFTTRPGKVNLGDNRLQLKRVRISGGMPLAAFQKLFP